MSHVYKRWYDHDPKLLEVIELLKNYQDELLEQAELFLNKLEEQVSKEAIDRFYELIKPVNGCRWYDKNPTISKTVEILRVVPPDVQKACAERFINALKEMGAGNLSLNLECADYTEFDIMKSNINEFSSAFSSTFS